MLSFSLGIAKSRIEEKVKACVLCDTCMVLVDFGVKNFGVVSFKLRKIRKD